MSYDGLYYPAYTPGMGSRPRLQSVHPFRNLMAAGTNMNAAWSGGGGGGGGGGTAHSGYGVEHPDYDYHSGPPAQVPSGGSYSYHATADTGYGVPAAPHPPQKGPSGGDKKGAGKKGGGGGGGSSVMTSLTLLSFFFFVNLLQGCLKDHMDSMNPTVMVMTTNIRRNRFNKMGEMNSREQSSGISSSSTYSSNGANIVMQPADMVAAAAANSPAMMEAMKPGLSLASPYSGIAGSVNNPLVNSQQLGAAAQLPPTPLPPAPPQVYQANKPEPEVHYQRPYYDPHQTDTIVQNQNPYYDPHQPDAIVQNQNPYYDPQQPVPVVQNQNPYYDPQQPVPIVQHQRPYYDPQQPDPYESHKQNAAPSQQPQYYPQPQLQPQTPSQPQPQPQQHPQLKPQPQLYPHAQPQPHPHHQSQPQQPLTFTNPSNHQQPPPIYLNTQVEHESHFHYPHQTDHHYPQQPSSVPSQPSYHQSQNHYTDQSPPASHQYFSTPRNPFYEYQHPPSSPSPQVYKGHRNKLQYSNIDNDEDSKYSHKYDMTSSHHNPQGPVPWSSYSASVVSGPFRRASIVAVSPSSKWVSVPANVNDHTDFETEEVDSEALHTNDRYRESRVL